MASLLAVVMLFSVVGISPAVFADDAVAPELKANSGEVIIKSGMTNDEVAQILNKALISNYDELDDATKASLQWEYYCEGKNLLLTNNAWGSINGFTSTKKVGWKDVTYTHAALKDADDGVYKLRLAGTTTEATLVKADKYSSTIAVNKEVTEIGLIFNADNTINYDALAQRIFDVLVNTAACTPTITRDDVTIEYKYVFGLISAWVPLEGTTSLPGLKEGAHDIRITFNGNDAYKATEATHTANFVDNRIASSIVYKDGAQITYNMDASVMEEAIVNNTVNFADSKLPEGVTASDFTVEYYGSYVDSFKVEHNAWVSIAGGKSGIYTYPQMGAGEWQVRVTYNGADYYKASSNTGTLTVNKATVKVSVTPITTIYAGEEIDRNDFYTLDPNDPELDVYAFFVGVNSNMESCVNIKLSEGQEKLIDEISKAQEKWYDLINDTESLTLEEMLQKGTTLGEIKDVLNGIVTNKTIMKALELVGYDTAVKNFLEAFNTLTSLSDDTIVAIGTPAHAGVYTLTAIATGKNYETAEATGSVTVLKNWTGIKLAKNPILDSNDNKITVSQANELAKGNNLCILTKDGEALNNASAGSIHYWFTGVGKLYAKSTMPTAPGKYIVTASVRGGDFFAMPKTFTFTIVADPTPEVTPEA